MPVIDAQPRLVRLRPLIRYSLMASLFVNAGAVVGVINVVRGRSEIGYLPRMNAQSSHFALLDSNHHVLNDRYTSDGAHPNSASGLLWSRQFAPMVHKVTRGGTVPEGL